MIARPRLRNTSLFRGAGKHRSAGLCAGILMLALSGCVAVNLPLGSPSKDYQTEFMKHFEKAAFSISGGEIFVRSDDTNPWQSVNITLDTAQGYYRQTAGDMEPGQVRELVLKSFVDQSGNAFGPGIQIKSVWVQARYPNGEAVNELAFPAETFGYRSPVPPGK